MSVTVKQMTQDDLDKMIKEHYELNPDRPIRPDIKEALDRWANDRIMPGDFLRAVLENNLMEALARADSYNRATIFQICQYVYNELPSLCHGSRGLVESWSRGEE